MEDFAWKPDAPQPDSLGADAAYALLGLSPAPQSSALHNSAPQPAPSTLTTDAAPPALTRRELRAREQAAAARVAAASPAAASAAEFGAASLSASWSLEGVAQVAQVAPAAPVFSAPAPAAPVAAPSVAAPSVTQPSAAAPTPAVAWPEPSPFSALFGEQAAPASAVFVQATPAASVAPAPFAAPETRAGNRGRSGPKAPRAARPPRTPRGARRGPVSPPRDPNARRITSTSASGARKPVSLRRQVLSKLMTFGAMIGAGLMMVSTSIPANAFLNPDTTMAETAEVSKAAVQSVSVQPVAELSVSRDGYTAVSLREQIFLLYGNRNFSFTNNPNGTIQWPFPIGVPISSGFGDRVAPCGGCSSNHLGVDFTPGIGTAIQAIADGTVSAVAENNYGLGSYVIIDHQIDGKFVQTIYGHMLRGSIRVTLGQQVKVADTLGQVGSTGASTGAHLHLEIHVNKVAVDPFAWLKANAN